MDSNISGLTLLNRYTLHERLGRGGMGEVYHGTDVNLERPVAIKVLHGHLADEEGWAFLGEVGNLLQKKQLNF